MKAFSGSIPIPRFQWLFGAMALLFLPACATTRWADEEQPSDTDAVDVGYGTVEKDQVIGSVATVHAGEQQATYPRTLADMLVGQFPGVQVTELAGGRVSVRIRGTNSFIAGNEPLWVIDGMVLQFPDGGLPGINPNSIESISILKDAGSTAIYGSRGANGVILIKTKRKSN